MCNKPQKAVYSHKEWASSSLAQWTASQGQPVLAGKCGCVTVFDAAQPAFRGDPERTVAVELRVPDMTLAQTISDGVRFTKLTVFEIRHAAVTKSDPQAAFQMISDQNASSIGMSQRGPRDLFSDALSEQMKRFSHGPG